MATYDPGFEIPFPSALFMEFGDPIVALGVQTYSGGFELGAAWMGFGPSIAAPGVQTFSAAFEIPASFMGFGNGFNNLLKLWNFSKGFEILPRSRLWFPTDTAFEILPSVYQVPPFALPAMTEIHYPVIPVSEAQKVLTRLDSEEIRVTNKVASPVNREIDTIRFRVDTASLASFLDALDANRLITFRLTTAGYTPFGTNSQDNYVRVVTRSRPQRDEQGQTYTVDVLFRFVATYP